MLLLAASCTSDDVLDPLDPQSGGEVKAHFSLSTRAASGTGTFADPVSDVERINRYWVVFTDGTAANKVVALVKKELEPAKEQDEFTVSLSPGTYKVYAFANMADDYLGGLHIVQGEAMPDLSQATYLPADTLFGNDVSTLLPVERLKDGIPMTSVNGMLVNITNAVTVASSIEVVRLFAKLEFVFKNETGQALTLRSQKVSNLSVNKADNTGFIPLYNDDTREFGFLDGMPFKTLAHSYADGGLTLAADASQTTSKAFYVLESKADETTNSFQLDFDIKDDHIRYGLTDPSTLTVIRRNDWIRIPIIFSDWQMRLEAHTYPPIGGYPEAKIEETVGNEFMVKFDGGGDFSIRPFIRKISEGDAWFGIDNAEKVVIDKTAGSESPKITFDDPDGIFITAPALTASGEIRGKMKVVSGKTASITIEVKVKTSASGTKTITRKIFVTQK